MKIAISATGDSLESELDPRFGRAKNFIIYDTETESVSVKSNDQNLHAAQGAGIQAAQHILDSGVEAVVSGHMGPKAFQVLQTAGIQVFLADRSPVQDVLQRYKQNELEQISGADVEGHWV